MKNMIAWITLFISLTSCQMDFQDEVAVTIPGSIPVNDTHPMKDSIDALVKNAIQKGIPGMQVMVKNADGWYVANGGYSKIETRTPINDNMVVWLYSITKTYTATLTMKLKERGLIDLDKPISAYLDERIVNQMDKSDRVTVRQLLNQSSGYPEIVKDPAFMMNQLNNPRQVLSTEEMIAYAYKKPTVHDPGKWFFYSNTNYGLLTLILERVSGKSYSELLEKEILEPLDLKKTYGNLTDEQLVSLGFPNYYFERYNNGQLENITNWHNNIAQSLSGMGGVAGNGADVIKFFEGLFGGEIISNSSLQEMRTWIRGDGSDENDYGLGLEYYGKFNSQIPTETYGHEGDNLGGTIQFLYVPVNDTYVFIQLNVGKQLWGEYFMRVIDAKQSVCKYVARYRKG
jgi:D-alanyl-D-alanine carboxypeptidase